MTQEKSPTLVHATLDGKLVETPEQILARRKHLLRRLEEKENEAEFLRRQIVAIDKFIR